MLINVELDLWGSDHLIQTSAHLGQPFVMVAALRVDYFLDDKVK